MLAHILTIMMHHLTRLLHFIDGSLPLTNIVYIAWLVGVGDLASLHAAGRLGDDHR